MSLPEISVDNTNIVSSELSQFERLSETETPEPDQMKRTLSNALYLLVQPLLLNALSIPTTAYIIRQLGATGYGQWAAATALCGVLGALASPGLSTLYIRNVAQKRNCVNELQAEQMGLRMALAVIAGLLAVGISICVHYPTTVIWCVAVTAFSLQLTTISGTMINTLQGLERIKIYSTANFTAGILVTAATVYAAWRGTGPVGVSVAYLVNPLVVIVILITALIKCGVKPTIRFRKSNSIALLKDSSFTGASQYLGMLTGSVENVLIPKLLGLTVFGYYSAGTILINRLSIVPDSISTAFFPLIARTTAEDTARSHQQAHRLVSITLVACLPLSVLLYLLAEPIAHILFPHKGAMCVMVMRITTWALPLLAISMPVSYSLQASGHYNATAKIGMICTAFSLVASILMVLQFGIRGICFALLLRIAICLLAMLPLYQRYFPGAMRSIPLLTITVCTVGMTAAGVIAARMMSSSLSQALLGSAVSVAVYLVLLMAFRVPQSLGIRYRRKLA